VFRQQLPKATTEHGITCLPPAPDAGDICGKSVIWFDYQLGEKEFYKGFIYEAHRVSN